MSKGIVTGDLAAGFAVIFMAEGWAAVGDFSEARFLVAIPLHTRLWWPLYGKFVGSINRRNQLTISVQLWDKNHRASIEKYRGLKRSEINKFIQ
jgi:hypothetical protein